MKKLLIISLVFTQLVTAMNPQERAAAPDEEQNIARHQVEANQVLNAAISVLELQNIVIDYLGVDDAWNLVKSFNIEDAQVWSLALTKDKKQLFVGYNDSVIRMYDTDTGKCIKIFEGHKAGVTDLALTHNNTFLVSSSRDNTIKVWDVKTGQCITDIQAASDPFCLGGQIIISKDSKYIVSFKTTRDNDGFLIEIWDLQTGELRNALHKNDPISSICLTDNEEMLIIGSLNKMIFFNFITGEYSAVETNSQGEDLEVSFIKYNVKSLSYYCKESGTFTVMNDSKQIINKIKIYQDDDDENNPIAVTKDNQYVFASTSYCEEENKIDIWDLKTGECIHAIKSNDEYSIDQFLISDDENYIVAACNDSTIKIFKTRFSKRIAERAEQQHAAGAAMPAVAAAAARAVPNNGGAAAPIEVVAAGPAIAQMDVAASVVLGEKRESELDLQDQERSKKRQKIDPNDPQEMDDSERK